MGIEPAQHVSGGSVDTVRGSSCGPGVLLEAVAVSVNRGRRPIITEADVVLRAGEIANVSGGNGAGKTTLLRALCGVFPVTSGRIVRSGSCALVPEKVVLAPEVRVDEWLESMRRVRRGPAADWRRALLATGLDASVLRTPTKELSKGMLQRVALVEAFAGSARLILLDEPFAGLDEVGRAWLVRTMRDHLDDAGGVLYTDHSGAAAGRIQASASYVVRDGRCVLTSGQDVNGAFGSTRAAIVRIVVTDVNGRRAELNIPLGESDDELRRLLDAGCHVEAVIQQ